ncbi:MAG: hypothetical protein ABSF24_06010 [Candidatus Bathyarchaeia archaeon]|jgi:hypothetical protein
MEMEKIARWAFVAVVVIAIVMGLVVGYMANVATAHFSDSNVTNASAYVTLILVILGIVVGFISVTAKEVTPFLVAAIALIVAGLSSVGYPNIWYFFLNYGTLNLLYYWATEILTYIVAFVAPAVVIIALRSLLAMEKAK